MVACGEVGVLGLEKAKFLFWDEEGAYRRDELGTHRTNEMKHGSNHKSKND